MLIYLGRLILVRVHMRLFSTVATVMCTSLLGCASPKPPPEPVPPPEFVSVPQDRAVIYFLRPKLDQTDAGYLPQLLINGQPIVRMPWPSYTYVELLPGEHIAEIQPTEDRGSRWRAQGRICAVAGNVYYAVLWDQAQPMGDNKIVPVPLPGGGIIPIFRGRSFQNGSVVVELVQPEVAKEALYGLRKVQHQLGGPLSPATSSCRGEP
jgi:hypothetical protein